MVAGAGWWSRREHGRLHLLGAVRLAGEAGARRRGRAERWGCGSGGEGAASMRPRSVEGARRQSDAGARERRECRASRGGLRRGRLLGSIGGVVVGPTVAAWRRGAAELGSGLGPLAGWRAGRRPVVLPPQRLRPALDPDLDLDLDLVVLGPRSWWLRRCRVAGGVAGGRAWWILGAADDVASWERSEERRVGKEC